MRQQFVLGAFVVVVAGVLSTVVAAQRVDNAVGFELRDTAGDHLDVLLDGRIAARYMYAYDNSTPERRVETYKPYLHVFDAEGKSPITKGPGGLYTHHRGIFAGWTVRCDGRNYGLWSMSSDMVHQKFLQSKRMLSRPRWPR
jgi:hypothetical protein